MTDEQKKTMDIQANVEIREKRGKYSDCRYWQEWSLVQE
jgi:hypothetical protein